MSPLINSTKGLVKTSNIEIKVLVSYLLSRALHTCQTAVVLNKKNNKNVVWHLLGRFCYAMRQNVSFFGWKWKWNHWQYAAVRVDWPIWFNLKLELISKSWPNVDGRRRCYIGPLKWAVCPRERACYLAQTRRRLQIGWSDVTESMVIIRSPFCGYNMA